MRVNLTLDDDLGRRVTEEASRLKLTETEFIRQTLTSVVGSGLAVGRDKFSLLSPIYKMGYCIEVDGRWFFMAGQCGEMNLHRFTPEGEITEIPSKLVKYFDKFPNKEYRGFGTYSGLFTAIQLPSGHEYLLCKIEDGQGWPTQKTFEKQDKCEKLIVNGKFLSTFFTVA